MNRSIRELIGEERKYYTIRELKSMGLSNYRINRLTEEGVLIRLNKSTYENSFYRGDISDFAQAKAYAPKGILCMMTAARYYDLTVYLPDCVDVAIEHSMKVSTLPDWPQMKIWYFREPRYTLGITTCTDSIGEYQIYDVEKTVADIIHFRNRIGIEETKEVLNNYLSRSDRDLAKLHNYAEKLRCAKTLSTYLEVLL